MAYLYYMKKLFFAVSFFLCTVNAALAQKDSLQFDEANHYVYYHVAEKPGMSNDTLYDRGLKFVKVLDTKITGKPTEYAIVTKGNFVVYGSSLISKKEAGEVTYQLNIDTKEGKYRFKFSEFVFIPYKLDRYGNMVAMPGIFVPAEKLSAQYSKKESDVYLDQIGTFCKNAARQLSICMDKKQAPKKAETIKKVQTDKW